MADRFDVVAVAIEHERAVIVRMILRAQSRRAVVLAARSDRRIVEGFHRGAVRCDERDVALACSLALRDPEIGPLCAQPNRDAKVHLHFVSKRRQRRDKEAFAFRQVRNCQTNVIEHGRYLRR